MSRNKEFESGKGAVISVPTSKSKPTGVYAQPGKGVSGESSN